MTEIYGRDLDLNLLRVFVVVASAGSVTRAAQQLYLTQPAISAALRRLTSSTGVPLFARSGRGLTLTARGEQLFERLEPLLRAMVEVTLAPPHFDSMTSERVLRIGLSDTTESLLLAPLLRVLEREAPRMRVIALPVQFRTVSDALASRQVDMAITVADELPSSVRRQELFRSSFVCLFDARRVRLKPRFSEREYFAREHVIVSYNGDLRGVVEDSLHKQRQVRCAVASFAQVGEVLNGSPLIATVPIPVALHMQTLYPHLKSAPCPVALRGAPVELLWPQAVDGDEACRFVREHLARIAAARFAPRGANRRKRSASRADARAQKLPTTAGTKL